MKQTQSINLGGYSFIVEIDALERLENYLSQVKASTSSEMSEELLSDIEERLAELFIERCGRGSVIDVASVEYATSRIGVPESDDNSSSSQDNSFSYSSEGDSSQKKERKRFYRNMNDRVLGGVCSGVGKYFGIDVLIIRLILGGLLLLSTLAPFYLHLTGELILVYVLLWVILPAPKTVEQQCEAEGKPFSYDEFKEAAASFKEKARDGMNDLRSRAPEVKDAIRSTAHEARTAPALRTLVRVVAVIVGVIFSLIGISTLVTTAFTGLAIPSDLFTIDRLFPLDDKAYVLSAFASNPYVKWSCLASISLAGIAFLYAGIKAVFDISSPKWHPGFIILILWFIATLLFVLFVSKYAFEFFDVFETV